MALADELLECLSVSDHTVGLALKCLIICLCLVEKFFKASSNTASGSQTSTKKPQTPPSYPMKRSPSRSTPNSVTGYSISPSKWKGC